MTDKITIMNGLARNVAMVATSTTANPRQFKGFIVEYVGASESALFTVGATTIAMAIGATGAEADDANFTVGGTPGTIDLANAAANTAGELVDFINSLTDYKCRLVGLRRADVISASGYFVAATSQQAKVPGVGYAAGMNTAVALHITAELSVLDGGMFAGNNTPTDKTARGYNGARGDYKAGALVELYQLDETLTYTGAGLFEVIEVDDFAKTDEVIYSNTIPGATTAAGSKSFGQLGVSGITARKGKRLLVRCRAASTLSAITSFVVYGKLKNLE